MWYFYRFKIGIDLRFGGGGDCLYEIVVLEIVVIVLFKFFLGFMIEGFNVVYDRENYINGIFM